MCLFIIFPSTSVLYTLSLHDALPIWGFDAVVIGIRAFNVRKDLAAKVPALSAYAEAGGTVIEQYNRPDGLRSEEHTSELQSRQYLVCRLLLEKKKNI